MKKTFFISVILLFALLTGCAHNSNSPAKDPSPVSDFQYETNEEGGITITKYLGTDQDVIIPAKIKDKAVTQIGERAFSGNERIVSVEIPDSVTTIAQFAFKDCSLLVTVSLPQNLKSIGDAVFVNCIKLSSVSLPRNLKSIGNSVFINCIKLSSVSLPDTLTCIEARTFTNCTLLKHISILKKH